MFGALHNELVGSHTRKVSMDINQDAIRKWIEALRSGKYKQTRGRLADRIGFCCLGVACEVAIENGVKLTKKTGEDERATIEYEGCCSELPDEVTEWFGLCSEGAYEELPAHATDPPLPTEDHPDYSASQWNDQEMADFATIANLIEATYLR
jgi:hypothetical protein